MKGSDSSNHSEGNVRDVAFSNFAYCTHEDSVLRPQLDLAKRSHAQTTTQRASSIDLLTNEEVDRTMCDNSKKMNFVIRHFQKILI